MTNEETGLGPRFDQASIFQFEIGLDGCRHADAMLPAGPANGRNSVPGAEDATFDQLTNVGGDARIKRFAPAAGDSRGNHEAIMSHRSCDWQTVPAQNLYL